MPQRGQGQSSIFDQQPALDLVQGLAFVLTEHETPPVVPIRSARSLGGRLSLYCLRIAPDVVAERALDSEYPTCPIAGCWQ
jgi:hypothetical protein